MAGFEGFDRIGDELKTQSDLLKRLEKLEAQNSEILSFLGKFLWEAQTNRKMMEILRTAATREVFLEIQEFVDTKQLGFNETLHRIADEELSFTRFGDGELSLMLRPDYKLAFQQNSSDLRDALKKVLRETPEGLLVGFPYFYRDLHWSRVWCDIWDQTKELFSSQKVVGNAHVSRPVYFQSERNVAIENWRRIWENKRVCIITGEGSRFELPDALFAGCSSSEFLYSSAKNAFSDRKRILETLDVNRFDDIDLYLIALGPAGTVLTYDLAKSGRRAIDIGHLPNSYANVFGDGKWPEAMPVNH